MTTSWSDDSWVGYRYIDFDVFWENGELEWKWVPRHVYKKRFTFFAPFSPQLASKFANIANTAKNIFFNIKINMGIQRRRISC